ncbi:hypothetical protein MKW98_020534, partial [Papaver atlanticum]
EIPACLGFIVYVFSTVKRRAGRFDGDSVVGVDMCGERVLWCAVKAFQEVNSNLDCIIYTGDHDASPESLLTRAIYCFGVKLLQPPQVVHLYKRKWIEEGTYPRFTMVGQSFWFSLSVLGSSM